MVFQNPDSEMQRFFLVLEYMTGQNLSQFLEENPDLDWQQKIDIGKEIANSLKHIHSNGLIHGELYPSRILFATKNSLKITGLCLNSAIEEAVISKALFDGSMIYIDPAFLENPKYKKVSSSDIYSLGILLWEISSGRRAFSVSQNRGIIQLTYAIINGEREAPVDGTPYEYVRLYQRCWNSDPLIRPHIDEVIEALATIKLFQQMEIKSSKMSDPEKNLSEKSDTMLKSKKRIFFFRSKSMVKKLYRFWRQIIKRIRKQMTERRKYL
ncbi:hypothetical protein G9A89_010099 [Geosiphon pyriformis]|nr:hypothetical protein G9A89_010099 [Geosiphon pyriformis]